ncbi:MAG TPA: pitrilysin family protein [Steroidobacteraceae bacterium]|nr:pitrilysin family protein [Steroidobacteraceae bacterium]
MRHLCLAAALALLGSLWQQDVAAGELPGADRVATRMLDNGMQIVVWPDADIPNVAMYTWYRVGSRNEHPGITGISHFFEHMMFNGTKTRPPGEFDRVMEANGGRNNAYTSSDVTVYQNWFPRTALELIFELEADRMRNLDFDPKVVESERGVVYSERRSSVDNDNFGVLIEQMQASAYVAHPYQIPTIGWPSDIEGWKIEDLQAFYQQYYAPNNAVMFVVGDVTPEEVFALAGKHLAGIPAQPAPEPVITREPPQLGERRLRIEREGQTPLLAMAWHAAAAPDRESRVLEVTLAILGDGDSSRLHQRLVERERAAIQVGTALDQGFDPGLAWVYAIVPPGGDPARTEQLVDEELARLAADGPSAAELTKARNQALAGFWRGLETISGKAQALGEYQVFHDDYRKLFEAPTVYQGITADDVRAAVADILRSGNRTVGTLVPVTAEQAPVAAQVGAK